MKFLSGGRTRMPQRLCSLRLEQLEDRLQPGSLLPWMAWSDLEAQLGDFTRDQRTARGERLLAAPFRLDDTDAQQPVDLVARGVRQEETGSQIVTAETAPTPAPAASQTPADLLQSAANRTPAAPVSQETVQAVRAGTPIQFGQVRTGAMQGSDLSFQLQPIAPQAVDLTKQAGFFSRPARVALTTHDVSDPTSEPGIQARIEWATYATYSGAAATARAVATDAEGSMYVTGWIEYGNSREGFISKYGWDGGWLYFATFQVFDLDPFFTYTDTEPHGLAVDDQGNMYLTGHATRTVLGRDKDAFALKISADFTSGVYGHTYGSLGFDDDGWGIAVDSGGNAYVTGNARVPPLTHNVVFAGKLNPTGQRFLYIQGYTGQGYSASNGLALTLDPQQANVYISGWIKYTGLDETEFFGLKVTAAQGAPVYAFTTPPNIGNDSLDGIAVDSEGYAYVTGTIIVKGQTPYGYAAKINQIATDSIWAVAFDDTNSGYGIAIVDDIIFTSGSSPEGGALDGYVVRLDPAGKIADSVILEGDGSNIVYDVALNYWNIAMAGSTTSTDIATDGGTLYGTRDGFLGTIGSWN